MNERIRELAEQAGMRFDRFGMVIPTTLAVQETVNLEKFAELIVKECAVFVENDDYRGVTLSDRLKRHFGVEE